MTDRSMVVGHVQMEHTFFYVHQSHRHDSHTPAFLWVVGTLGTSCMLIWHKPYQNTAGVNHFLVATSVSQMVTHPSTNWAHSCLTSVIILWAVAPCQRSFIKIQPVSQMSAVAAVFTSETVKTYRFYYNGGQNLQYTSVVWFLSVNEKTR